MGFASFDNVVVVADVAIRRPLLLLNDVATLWPPKALVSEGAASLGIEELEVWRSS